MVEQNSLQERRLRAAIESVFRRTHGREMTAEERQLFGLKGKRGATSRDGLTQEPPLNQRSDDNGKRRI